MPPDQNSRTVAFDFDLDRLRIDFDLPHVGRLAHLFENLLEDNHRLAALLLDVRALAPGRAAVIVAAAGRRRTLAPGAAVVAPAPLILAPATTPVWRDFVRRSRSLRCLP